MLSKPKKNSDVYDKNTNCLTRFSASDQVYVLNLRAGPRWLPGVVIEVLQRSYYVHVNGYPVWKRHESQLRPRVLQCKSKEDTALLDPARIPQLLPETLQQQKITETDRPTDHRNTGKITGAGQPITTSHDQPSPTEQLQPTTTSTTEQLQSATTDLPRRNPPRLRKAPERF